MSRKSDHGRSRADNLPPLNAPELDPPLTLPPKRYCPHVPTAKQLAFLLCPRTEAFFGGAAGPGKTDGLLMGALQLVEQPRYSALLLRRTFRQLNQSNSIMNRARQWLANTDAVWSNADKRFTFPSGAAITFGNLDSEDDVYQYDSSEFQYIGFDELTSFRERQYTYLFSRLRTTRDNPLPLRMRAASNPGNRGHDWVKTRFMIGQPPEALQRDFPSAFSSRHGSLTTPISAVRNTWPHWPTSTRYAGASCSRATGMLRRAAIYFAVNGSRSWTTRHATYLASYGPGTTLRPGMAVTGPSGC